MEPSIVAAAVEEAARLLSEEVSPARLRVKEMAAERDRVRRESDQLLNKLLTTGTEGLDVARRRLEGLDRRLKQLSTAIGDAEAALAQKETRHLDHELLAQALRDFDTMYGVMRPAERKELLSLLIEQVVVHPDDTVTLRLHDGLEATGKLEDMKRRRGSRGTAAGPQNDEGPTAPHLIEVNGRLAQRIDWLPKGHRTRKAGGW